MIWSVPARSITSVFPTHRPTWWRGGYPAFDLSLVLAGMTYNNMLNQIQD